MEEIIGVVTKSGRPKHYRIGGGWYGGDDTVVKFFIEVDSEEHGTVKAMVRIPDTHVHAGQYGPKIGESCDRQRPWQGDRVRFTTHTIKENDDGSRWASVTLNQEYEILEKNMEARKAWEEKKEEQRKKREEERKRRAEEYRRKRKEKRQAEIEDARTDERLPEDVRREVTGGFDGETILKLLRDTAWMGPVRVGVGGRKAERDVTGTVIVEGHPGTGLRRPKGCLYQCNEVTRQSILRKGLETGLIEQAEEGKTDALDDEDARYVATEKGVRTLLRIDRCDECGGIRRLYHYESFYHDRASGQTYSEEGYTYMCERKYEEAEKKGNAGSNAATKYEPVDIPERIRAHMGEVGE